MLKFVPAVAASGAEVNMPASGLAMWVKGTNRLVPDMVVVLLATANAPTTSPGYADEVYCWLAKDTVAVVAGAYDVKVLLVPVLR